LYRTVLAISMIGIVVVVSVVSWQVFSRYVTATSAAWAPEVAQLAFVWSALLAIAVGVRQGKHMVVDAFTSVKGRTVNLVLNSVAAGVVVTVSLALAWYGYDSLSVSFRRSFPSLGIATGWMYLAIPVGFGCCAVFALEGWVRSTFRPKPVGEHEPGAEIRQVLDGLDVSTNDKDGR